MNKTNHKSNKFRLIVADKISRYIEENNLSNNEFGKIFDVSETTVRSWKTNKSTPDIDQLVMLCQYWGISLDQLVNEDYASVTLASLTPTELSVLELSRQNKDYRDTIVSLKNMLKK